CPRARSPRAAQSPPTPAPMTMTFTEPSSADRHDGPARGRIHLHNEMSSEWKCISVERSEDSAPRTDPPLPVPEGLPEGVVDAVAASGGEVVFREFLSAIVLNAQAIADRLGLRLIDVQAAHLVTQ